jgi:peptidoglycan LD-endopeptidase LytH
VVALRLLLLLLPLAACGPLESLRDNVLRTPPYERHVAALRRAGVDRTGLGERWLAAGERALHAPRAISIPHTGTEQVDPSSPGAVAYSVELRRGQTYRLTLNFEERRFAPLFVDLFRMSPGAPPERVSSLGPLGRHLAFEPPEDATFVVRIQAAFLESGRIRIVHARRAALLFPVAGGGRRNVQSFFGAARGQREHQGIDIFAARGTPVLAAADGWISSTAPNQLGGNVVWLWDPARGHTLYYAHLDRHAVSAGQYVQRGDVIGFVGNTGNARTTAPHLHFGIYRRGLGAIDPLYYVVDPA